MIKAQVLVGGRGKAGGVKLAASGTEAEAVAAEILALTIKDIPVRKVLVAAAADIVKEYYLGAILDRASRRILVIASAEGGVEIEEVARVTPEAIHRVEAHPLLGLLDWQARQLAFAIGLGGPHLRTFVAIARGLVSTMLAYDADLVEVNPLAVVRQPDDTGTATEAPRLPRREDHPRRLGPRPPPRARGAARPRQRGSGRRRGARPGDRVHPPRRLDRLHGQWRRPGDDDDGPGQARRRRARELPRHRRRRASRQGRRGDALDPCRSEGPGDPRQHLRRDHPWRRGRPRADRGPGRPGARRARWSSGSSGRTPRRRAAC